MPLIDRNSILSGLLEEIILLLHIQKGKADVQDGDHDDIDAGIEILRLVGGILQAHGSCIDTGSTLHHRHEREHIKYFELADGFQAGGQDFQFEQPRKQ